MTRQINRRTPTDPGTARTKAAYEVIASKLAAEGDIFRRREDGLRIQLTRKLATTDWRLCEVVTMRRIEWHEI
ncbi:MAG: hypothetical protein GY842_25555, partial [bacterium]|nr:hypothetical protein [bacterium]